jgi:hypothetical protein
MQVQNSSKSVDITIHGAFTKECRFHFAFGEKNWPIYREKLGETDVFFR